MDEDDFERGFGQNDETFLGFNSYDEFAVFQRDLVTLFTEDSVTTMLFLADSLLNRFDLMDKESMVPFPASGFCFDINQRIVIFNER